MLRILPKGTHNWQSFVKPSELADAARHSGLEPLHFKGMGYNPFTEQYSLNSDTSVNYLLATRK